MRLFEERSGEVAIIQPDGRIDSNTAPVFGDRLNALVASGTGRLVVDFRHVLYITSAGFRSLLVVAKLIEKKHGKLVLCGVNGEVSRLFELTTFANVFTICNSREESIARASL